MSYRSSTAQAASQPGSGRTFGSSRLVNGQRLRSTMATPSLAPIGEKPAAGNPQRGETSTSRWPQPRLPSNLSGKPNGGSLSGGFRNMNLVNRRTIDPSNAPNRSAIDKSWRAPSQASTRMTGATNPGQSAWIRTLDCVRSPYGKSNFRKGQIVSLPFHVANTNDAVEESDPALTRTVKGPVYSKRRMAVVLWKYKTDMFCLPLFSFGNRGITAKPPFLRDEYIEITNTGEREGYVSEGKNKVLEATMIHALTKNGVVHISGGMRVSYQDDILSLGELTDESRVRLTRLWNELSQRAQEEQR